MTLSLPHRYDRYRLIALILGYQKGLYPDLNQIRLEEITRLDQSTISRLLNPNFLGEKGKRNGKLNRSHLLALTRLGLKMDHCQASLMLWLAEGDDYQPWTADEFASLQLEAPSPKDAMEANLFRTDPWSAHRATVELLGKKCLSNDGVAVWYPVETHLLQGNTPNHHLTLFQKLRTLESGPGQRMLVSKYPSSLVSMDENGGSELIVGSPEDMKKWLTEMLMERKRIFRANLAKYGERAIHSQASLKRFVDKDFDHSINVEDRKNRVRSLIQYLRNYSKFQVGLLEDIEPEVEIAIKSTREAVIRGTARELSNHPHTVVCGPSYMYWNDEVAVLSFYLEFERLWTKLHDAGLTNKKLVISKLKEIAG
jgi:hypothetical protein